MLVWLAVFALLVWTFKVFVRRSVSRQATEELMRLSKSGQRTPEVEFKKQKKRKKKKREQVSVRGHCADFAVS